MWHAKNADILPELVGISANLRMKKRVFDDFCQSARPYQKSRGVLYLNQLGFWAVF